MSESGRTGSLGGEFKGCSRTQGRSRVLYERGKGGVAQEVARRGSPEIGEVMYCWRARMLDDKKRF